MPTNMVVDDCPSDPAETADLYMMNHLGVFDRLTFERHLAECPKCRRQLKMSEEFRDALRRATIAKSASA